MGRGRAKAKQTRVARELKYHSPSLDPAALQRELAGGGRRSAEDDFSDYGGHYDADDADDEEDPPAADGGGAHGTRRH